MPEFDLDAALSPAVSGHFFLNQRAVDHNDDDVGLEPGQIVVSARDVFAHVAGADGSVYALIGTVYELSPDPDDAENDEWVSAHPNWVPENEDGEEWWNRETWWRLHQSSFESALKEVQDEFTRKAPLGCQSGCSHFVENVARLEPCRE